MANLMGKVALITGASSGIGAGTAVHFVTLGCKVSLSGRNMESLLKVSEDCKAAGAKDSDVLIVPGDISSKEDMISIVQATLEHFKTLSILVNSAGIISSGTTENTSLDDFEKMMNINARSVFYMSQLAIPHLKKSKGCIVNVSSIAGIRSFPGVMAYCMSKSAVDQLTRCAALELAADGVRVNSVNPGVIVTEIHKRGGMSEKEYAAFLEHCKDTHALGRPGTADEVAKSIAFLANDNAASFITGVNLPVDGGRGVMCPR